MTKNSQSKINRFRGFSLIEMLIAIFIFSIVMSLVFAAFVSLSKTKKQAEATQKNMEDARDAFEYMAKTIRSSSYFTQESGGETTIQMYDNSTKQCVGFLFETVTGNPPSNKLKVFKADPTIYPTTGLISNGYKYCYLVFNANDLAKQYVGELQTGFSNGSFTIDNYVKDASGSLISIPQITIYGELEQASNKEGENKKETIKLQTTVSARNYNEANRINVY